MQSRTSSIALIVVGTILLLMNLDLFSFEWFSRLIFKWWPVVLIVVGAAGLMGGRRK